MDFSKSETSSEQRRMLSTDVLPGVLDGKDFHRIDIFVLIIAKSVDRVKG